MSNAVAFDYYPDLAGTFELPSNRGVFGSTGLILFQRQSLPTDPIGTTTLTLTNVVVGSSILIRDQGDTTTHYSGTAASSTVEIAVTVYGSALDNWLIKVRKASASPTYIPWETQMTATDGAITIYVSQISDE